MERFLVGGLVVALIMFVLYIKVQKPTNQTNYDIKVKARQIDMDGNDVEVLKPELPEVKKERKGLFRKIFRKKK